MFVFFLMILPPPRSAPYPTPFPCATHFPAVGMALDPATNGYWLVADNGTVSNFGGAPFEGPDATVPLNAPIAGMNVDQVTGGYWLVSWDGGIFAFGAGFFGAG